MQFDTRAQQAQQIYQARSIAQNITADNKQAANQSAKGLEKAGKRDGFEGECPACQCEKCRSRRYQDGSNDSRVSFQMPTVMDPVKARSRVMSHEMEHVRSEQHKAKKENKIVVSQTVRIMNDRCEECGKNYVKGGFTRTITRPSLVNYRKVLTGAIDKEPKKKLIGIA